MIPTTYKEKAFFLTEELHSFENQYELAKELAAVTYRMAMDGEDTVVYNPQNNNVINTVDLTVETPIVGMICGRILAVNQEESKISFHVIMPQHYLETRSKEINLKYLANAIMHELMHGNIYMKRLGQELELEDYPSYYDLTLKLANDDTQHPLIRDIAYALYATYYQETASLVSQTEANIRLLAKDRNIATLSPQTIKSMIIYCEPWNIFWNISHGLVPTMKQFDDDDFNFVIRTFSDYGFQTDKSFWIKKIGELEKKSKIALKKITRNAMLVLKDVKKQESMQDPIPQI